jgi:EmrB/QacA subfamily drug resistance transporter
VEVDTATRRWVIAGLVLSMVVAAMNQTSVAAVVPSIVADLGGLEHYSWVFVASMLAASVSAPVFGKLSDLYGRRPLFVVALVTFLVGAVLCGVANSMVQLIAARALQGLAMGGLLTLAQTAVADVVPAERRGAYQSVLAVVFGAATVLGPLGGGLIAEHFGWRWIFFVNLPLGLVALAIVGLRMHIPLEPRARSIDVAGTVTLGIASTSGLLATLWGGVHVPWASWTIVLLYALCAVMLVAFVEVERRAEEPIVPLQLFRIRTVAAANIAGLAIGAAMFGSVLFIPLYVQVVLGRHPAMSGGTLVPLIIGFAAAAAIAGAADRWLRVPHRAMPIVGALLCAYGFLQLSHLDPLSEVGDAYSDMLLVGAGLGLAIPALVNIVQQSVSTRHLGAATSTHQFARSIGGTVGLAVMGAIVNNTLTHNIRMHVPDYMRDAAQSISFEDLRSPGTRKFLDPDRVNQVPSAILDAVRAGLSDSLTLVFVLCIPLCIVVALSCLAMKRRSGSASGLGEGSEQFLRQG